MRIIREVQSKKNCLPNEDIDNSYQCESTGLKQKARKKNAVKYTLPKSSKKEVTLLKNIFRQLQASNSKNQSNKNATFYSKIQKIENELSDLKSETINFSNYIKGIEINRTALYYSGAEHGYYEKELSKGFLAIDQFEERYLKLTRNLPDSSLNTIAQIINRLKLIYELDIPIFNFFNKEEQEDIRNLREHFFANVVQIGKEKYCYQNYFLPINHFEPCVFYYRHSLDRLRDLEDLREKDLIDAGGFIGDSALIFSPLTNRKVYSFEPSPENYANFQKTIELNQLDNVVLEPLALSDQAKKITFNLSGSASSAHPNESFDFSEKIEVEAISLDEYVEKNNLEVGLIKTDLEGAEMEFLIGAAETIKKFKPILLISIYHSIGDFLDIKPMIESWELGYQFEIVKPIDGSIIFETVLIAEVPNKGES